MRQEWNHTDECAEALGRSHRRGHIALIAMGACAVLAVAVWLLYLSYPRPVFVLEQTVTECTTEPVTEPITEPETEPETEPTTEPETEPATQPDTIPPQFGVMADIRVQLGNSVSYKADVIVTDDRDGELTFEIDASQVDLRKVGEYTVLYTAHDSSGNATVAERKVIVQEQPVVNRELVDKLAQETLAKIVTEDMTPQQKVRAVFNWVRRNMTYAASPETELLDAAYVAFTGKRGDCTNYYAVTSVLLDNCGIQNMKIERSGGESSHIWLLVNAGTGWYHLDTSPQSLKYPFKCFMKTDQEVWEYAQSRGDGRDDYYQFDTEAYPQRATEKFSE